MKSFRRAGTLIVIGVCAAMSGCTNSAEPSVSKPVTLEAVTPSAFIGVVGTQASPSPAVRVMDMNGNPVAGVAVVFTTLPGNGFVASTSSISDAGGVATAGSWTLGTQVGIHSLTAHLPGLPPMVFLATAESGPFAKITMLGGDKQSGVAAAPLPTPLSVSVTDSYGNPVKGVPVTFAVKSGDGRIDDVIVLSDSMGTAVSAAWTLGPTVGLQYAAARSGEKEVVFEAFATQVACETTCPAGSIAFERSGRVMIVSEDGSKMTALAEGSTPSWSPDGTQIVYSKSESLWIVNTRTGEISALTNPLWAADAYPSWSPDGSKVAFFRWVDGPDQAYLVVIDVRDHTERVVAMWWPVEGQLTWSPDGARIAFTCEGSPPGWESDICVVPSGGNAGYFYTQASNQGLTTVTFDGWINSDPAWRPDGRLLAFTTNRAGPPYIALIKPDGSDFAKLVPGHHASWSPDGSQIVFAGNADAPGLHVINADGTGLRRITDNAGDTAPSWKR